MLNDADRMLTSRHQLLAGTSSTALPALWKCTTPIRACSFVTHFAKQVHWDGAKDEDAMLPMIMGEGPATSTRRKKNWGGRHRLDINDLATISAAARFMSSTRSGI
jgi:hypothetical protein